MAERTLGILLKAIGAAQAAALIGRVDSAVGNLGKKGGLLNTFGSKVGYASRQIGGLAAGLGPLVGVAGITGLGAAFGSSLAKATEFGVTVSKLQGVLNLDAETTSALVDTLDKFGIAGDTQVTVLGRMEKNVAALADTQAKAKKFQKDYGFNLLDTNGNIADANTLLLRAADYYKSNAKATDKATVLNKLYGKTWADMIPVLDLGSQGIKEEEKNAIHLTKTQLDNIGKFKVAQRNFADTIGDLQVKVGAELMPSITGALKTVSTWLDTHSDEVVSFFKGAADFGAQLADGASKAFGAIQKGWDLIPGPLKTLLIEGFVAGKVTKFLFDFGPMDAAKLGSKLFGGVAGGLLQRGGSPANPVFVADVAGGGLGGVGDVAALGGKAALVTAAGAIAVTALGSAALIAAIQGLAAQEVASGAREGKPIVNMSGGARLGGAFPLGTFHGPVGSIGDFGAPHPGSLNAGSQGPTSKQGLGNLADAQILARALKAGFHPSDAAITATRLRDVARTTERSAILTAKKSDDLKAAVQQNATTIVAGITAAIRNLPQSITNVTVTASDMQRVRVQRMNAVKPHGSRNSRIGGPTVYG